MIANAVVHRSCLDDSCIQVCIFDDRLEVTSPGMLYGGLDMQSAKSGKSKCRNTAIAEAFRYMGIIEAWGTGIPRMIKECREYGLREPFFEELGDSIRVTLFRKNEKESETCVCEGAGIYGEKNQYLNAGKSVFDEENHCLNRQKPSFNEKKHCLGVEKPLIDEKNHYLGEEKSLFGEKNHCLETTKPLSDTENQMFQGGEQVKDICLGGTDLTTQNRNILCRKLEKQKSSCRISNVTALNIKAVIESFSEQEVFGRKEIKEKLGYKDSKAGFLIEKMQELGLVEKVKGKGKGKYCFRK